jgi:hypothetical protein
MTHLSYQLAKELKDAGFPQGGSGSWLLDPDAVVIRSGARVYAPTLSELIEAFEGYSSVSLEMKDSRKLERWAANASPRREPKDWELGSTPEEAMARLWLELSRRGIPK